ncbi:protein of unknown function [Streptantibioticus cattleyicolor NRRL 8057 = DSM 46488]|nr:protein of unknown function [Streptantibioticus cattleyicolor NRRL 8057 = DSM 46488]
MVCSSIYDPNRSNPYQQWVSTYSGSQADTIRQIATGNCLYLGPSGSILSSSFACGATDEGATTAPATASRQRPAHRPMAVEVAPRAMAMTTAMRAVRVLCINKGTTRGRSPMRAPGRFKCSVPASVGDRSAD